MEKRTFGGSYWRKGHLQEISGENTFGGNQQRKGHLDEIIEEKDIWRKLVEKNPFGRK